MKGIEGLGPREAIRELTSQVDELRKKDRQLKKKFGKNTKVDVRAWSEGDKGYAKHMKIREKIQNLRARIGELMEHRAESKEAKRAALAPKPAPTPEEGDLSPQPPTEAPVMDDSVSPKNPGEPIAEPLPPVGGDPTPSAEEIAPAPLLEGDGVSDIVDAEQDPFQKKEFRAFVRETLGKRKGQFVSEEQLQHATVAYLLEKMHGEEVREAYLELRGEVKGRAEGLHERATRKALRKLVKEGVLSEEQAEKINGLTFRASHLDENRRKLGGGAGESSARGRVNRSAGTAFDHLFAAIERGALENDRGLRPLR
ncbi:hypothetical protein MRY87_02320 [bacterium]|nr:hypothetical protein [bacterium]